MAITNYGRRTVRLAGGFEQGDVVNTVPASEAITPGHLIERHSSSGVAKFRKHATAGGNTARIFALEQDEMNKGIDDAYASGDLVKAWVCEPGDVVNALIASGGNVLAGSQVESAGNGKVRAKASGTPIGTVVEDLDNSAGPGDSRIRIEIF